MAPRPPRTILVAGATGYVGGRLIPELLDRGERVRALARRPDKLRGRAFFDHPSLTAVRGDVTDPLSLRAALQGVDVAYYLVHSMAGNADFARLDREGAVHFATSCAAAGVQRIIYLSALGARGERGLSHHLASRHQTGDALRSAGVPVTELRAAVIVGSGSASYEMIHDLVDHLPVIVAPRWLRSRCEPIAIRDVVEYLVRVLDEPRSVGQSLDIGGGEVLTYQRMIEILANELGKRPLVIPVPLLTPRLSSWWLHLVTSVDFSIVQPLVEGLRNDVLTVDQRIRDWIPIELAGYRLAVQRAVKRSSTPARWSHWADAQEPSAQPAPAAQAGRRRYSDYRTFDAEIPARELFRRLTCIGGTNGYGTGVGMLWRARGALDRIAGGPGLRRGRPKGRLAQGDPLDFWRVAKIDEPRHLVLVAEMLAPGSARLEFRVESLGPNRSRLHQLAALEGSTTWTSMYWWAIVPLHAIVFPQLGRHIVDDPAAQ